MLAIPSQSGVLANDGDADGNILTVELIDGPTSGELGLAADGSFTYSPHDDFHGVDRFSYRVSDGYDPSDVATVELTVNSVNDLPTTVADSYFHFTGRAVGSSR